ncbi:Phage portal protein, lambda family [Gimesia alba]|uniref:Phage portal protein, lambda family n=1 Tax=Gimesia alba TaxID=2527973 RepID=A0A517RB06_9PLAN|nr:hypothetical protein [Gimesia alba]QDT41072.1 Phage portal protein, lambda family [Gimesia alba]
MSNGTAQHNHSTAVTVEDLRTRRDELKLLREVRELEYQEIARSQSLTAESLHGYMDYTNYVDPREWLTDSFGQPLGAMLGMAATDAREDGRDRPVIETEQDLTDMRSIARVMVKLNPYLTGVLDDLTNYVIGTGFTYTAMGRSKRNANPQLVSIVQDLLDEFEDLNKWSGNLEREIFQRGTRDGEAPLRLHHVGYGQVKSRIVEPEYITEPRGMVRELEEYVAFHHPHLLNWDSEPSSWSFGVHTPERDIEDHLGYFAEWNASGSDWEYICASDMVFIKSNTDRNVKRGLSDFYPVEGFSDRAMKLARNIASGATVQAAIAFIEQYETGVTGSQIVSMNEAVKSYTRSERKPGGGIKFNNVSHLDEATKLDMPNGRSFIAGPMGQSSAPLYLEVLQALLRAIGTRFSMPEYMVSGDASNGNYASSVEAGTPFVKACEAKQFFYSSHFKDMMWRVIRFGFAAGRFKGYANSFQEIKRQIEIDVAAPDIEVRDPHIATQRRAILFGKGILSAKTWAAQEGEDYEQELENIRADKKDNFEPVPNIISGSSVAVPAALGAPDMELGNASAPTAGSPAETPVASPALESIAKTIIGDIFSEAYP